MQTSTSNTESKTDSTNKIPSPIPAPPAPVEDTAVDDLGYTMTPEEKVKVETPPAKEEDKKVEKPATGYGQKPAEDKVEEPAKKEETPPSTDEEKVKQELLEVVKDLPEGVDKEKITKFASDNKLTKEQLQAYANLVKEESKLSEENQKAAIKKQRDDWSKDLANDPEFGGENFDKNVDRVEKVLEKYMPNTKKVLTEKGSMLPPYVMRDFLALSKVLNPTSPLVTGDPGQAEESKSFLDDMYV